MIKPIVKSDYIYGLMIEEIEDYAILLLDPKGTIMNWNKGAEKIKGYEAEEIIGKNFSVFYTDKDCEKKLPNKLIEKAIKEGKAANEGWRVKKDGSSFWGSILITSIHDEHKKIIGFSKVTRDLTERKSSEVMLKKALAHAQELVKTNESYRKMIEEIEDYDIILMDVKGTIMNWNKGVEKVKGYKAEEIIGKNTSIFYTEEDIREKLPERLLEEAKKRGRVINEGWRIKKNGSRFWGSILITAIHGDDNNVIGFSNIAHDLTEKKKSEELQKSLTKTQVGLAKIFNASPSGMAIVDIESGKFIEVNKSFQSTLGYTRKEAIGTTADELGMVSAETQQISFGKLKEQGYLKNEDVPCITKGGTKIDTIFSVEPFELEGKKCFLCVLHDVTAMKEVEEQITQLNSELKLSLAEQGLANSELEAFSYSVSHDLRAPLRAIRSYTKILQEDYSERLEEDAQKMMNSVSTNAERMSQLIDDLLAFSRMGKKELNLRRVKMTEVAKASLETIKTSLNRPIKAKITIHELLPVIADTSLMGVILTNLISNAIKYSAKAANPQIDISSYNKNGENIYVVKDNGVGFDMAYYDKLFGVFQRLHGMTEFEGTGIGLALVKRIVTRHGGRVWAEAEENKGATFYVALPTKTQNANYDNN
jgi:PAS domain S-box-containing protein